MSGIFKNFGKSLKDGVLDGISAGIVNAVKTSQYRGAISNLLNIGSASSGSNIYSTIYDDSLFSADTKMGVGIYNNSIYDDNDVNSKKTTEYRDTQTDTFTNIRKGINSPDNFSVKDDHRTDILSSLHIPYWGYDDFINERNMWIKGIQSPLGEPGWFYFKIFFDFDTLDGLFGGILNLPDPKYSRNSAAKYFLRNLTSRTSGKILENHIFKFKDRLDAVIKLTKMLSYINTNAPWFFKSINGLADANVPIINNFSQEKAIEIVCNPDAIDMRLTTILDLYKYICYDDINNCEVLPENLRKFDMYVLLFSTPIKKFHTAFVTKNGKGTKYNYKTTLYDTSVGSSTTKFDKKKVDDVMGFKLFCFQNCEIDITSLGAMIPGSVTNEQPYQLGNNTIKINYDRVYTYVNNDANQMMFGSTGFLYNSYSVFQQESADEYGANISNLNNFSALGSRFNEIYKWKSDTNSINPSQPNYNLVELSELVVHNNLADMTGLSLGNLYGDDFTKSSALSQTKTGLIAKKTNQLIERGAEKLLKWLGRGYSLNASSISNYSPDGWLSGYRETSVGSDYWKAKLNNLIGNYKSRKRNIRYIEGTANRQVGSEYWLTKLKSLTIHRSKYLPDV